MQLYDQIQSERPLKGPETFGTSISIHDRPLWHLFGRPFPSSGQKRLTPVALKSGEDSESPRVKNMRPMVISITARKSNRL